MIFVHDLPACGALDATTETRQHHFEVLSAAILGAVPSVLEGIVTSFSANGKRFIHAGFYLLGGGGEASPQTSQFPPKKKVLLKKKFTAISNKDLF